MKKLLIISVLLVTAIFAQAQNYAILHVEEVSATPPNVFNYCNNEYSGVVIYAQEGCYYNEWTVDFTNHYQNLESITIEASEEETYVHYSGCGLNRIMTINFLSSSIDNPFSEPLVWKRQGESIILNTNLDGYNFLWSNGSNENQIDVSEPSIYSVTISDGICLNETFSVEVRDNVEITLATCDLETNHNMVTWQTTPAQAQYINHVIIKRDGLQVGTAPYSDGQFTDNIGSGSASRTYTVTAIATDGTECPIVSYPKETIHMSYTLGMNSTIEIGWNTPTGYDLLGYNICEWHEEDGSLSVIDFVGASVTSYTCSESQFDQGNIVVQGVENGKDGETRLLSNRSLDIVGLGENEATAFKVYPNPANGVLFVETVCTPSLPVETYRIMNPIGQTVMQGQITSEKQQIDVRNLPNGVYFITVGGATRKFVVE